MKWKELIRPVGEYISPVFDISSDLGSVYPTFETQVLNPNNQKVAFFYSLSSDGIVWSDWKKIQEGAEGFLSDTEADSPLFKYKIEFESENVEKRPFVQKVKFSFSPYLYIFNVGDLEARPKLWITKRNEQGEVRITNKTTGQTLEIGKMNKNEELYVDNEYEELVSSGQGAGVYRYDDHNDEWLELLAGSNYIQGTGDFDIDIRFQGRLLVE